MVRARRKVTVVALVMTAIAASSCEKASVNVSQGYGPDPVLPAPKQQLIPTVHIAPAAGWPEGATPTASPDLRVGAFATGLDHPRWLHILPNGDVLVAESNAPARHDAGSGLKGFVMGLVMARAGAAVPSADRITLLRDADGDGLAETKSAFLTGLHSPFGMALVGDQLFVANTDAIVAYRYTPGALSIASPAVPIAPLPAGPINHHWTKDLIASPDGKLLFATVGSNSNVGENGTEAEQNRASILQIDPQSHLVSVFATGLRNANGLSWQPDSKALWVVVNERDEIGSDLVPDYMTSVQKGGFYGWPYSYFGQHVDERPQPPRPDLVAKAIVPDYALGPHTGSLGLTFSSGNALPAAYRNGAFVGQHGSWNRIPRSGYKVVFVPFSHGKPNGSPKDVLTGFVDDSGHSLGRPVGVEMAKDGALLVADDVGNTVWRVIPAKK